MAPYPAFRREPLVRAPLGVGFFDLFAFPFFRVLMSFTPSFCNRDLPSVPSTSQANDTAKSAGTDNYRAPAFLVLAFLAWAASSCVFTSRTSSGGGSTAGIPNA